MSRRERLATIIVTHNRPQLLLEALDSVADQCYRPLELIVVDDGSTPETLRAVEGWHRLARNHHELTFRYIRQHNQGPAAARNRGFAESRAALVQFMDDDDLMVPNALGHLAVRLGKEKRPAVSMASYSMLYEGCGFRSFSEPILPPGPGPSRGRLESMIAGHWFVPVHGYLFTRSALDLIGPWDTTLSSQEDDEFLLRAALRGIEFALAPKALVYYRQHNGVRRATPGKPGETLEQGLRERLHADLRIRSDVARVLREQGTLEQYRPSFHEWYRRLIGRYGPLIGELQESQRTLLSFVPHERPGPLILAPRPGRKPPESGEAFNLPVKRIA